jgi:hypothetical protein
MTEREREGKVDRNTERSNFYSIISSDKAPLPRGRQREVHNQN